MCGSRRCCSTSPSICCCTKFRDPGEEPEAAPVRPAQADRARVARRRLSALHRRHLSGATDLSGVADMACERITAGDHRSDGRRAPDQGGARPVQPDRLDRARQLHHLEDDRCRRPTRAAATSTASCCDSDWEAEFCRVVEAHPRVRAYVKNQNLGSRCRIATARCRAAICPTSSCRWTTAAATTIR